jgi:hypothetical protein
MKRTLTLDKETLAELSPNDLAGVRGGGYSFDNCLTWICGPLAAALLHAATELPARLTVADCA